VLNSWQSENSEIDQHPQRLIVQKAKGVYVGVSSVYDYQYRPEIYEDIPLYDWIRKAKRVKIPIDKQFDLTSGDDELDLIDSESKPQSQKHFGKTTVHKPDTVDLEIEFDKLNLKDNDSMIDLDIVDNTISVDEVSEDDSDSGYDNLFLEEHPLYQTHWIEFKD